MFGEVKIYLKILVFKDIICSTMLQSNKFEENLEYVSRILPIV